MTMLDDGTYQSKNEEENIEQTREDLANLYIDNEDGSDEELQPNEECLVTIWSLNAQPKEEEEIKEQMTNIFHSKCQVDDKVCMLIIDSGSCTNLASSYLVDKLRVKHTPHLWPYKLQ